MSSTFRFRTIVLVPFLALWPLLLASCGDSSTEASESPPSDPGLSDVQGSGEEVEDSGAKDEEPQELPPFARVEGQRGLRKNDAGALDGYTLIAPLNSKQVHLVDMEGEVAHSWDVDHTPGGGCYFLPNGHLLRHAMIENNPRFHGGGIAGRIEERDWDGNLVWVYELANDQHTTHHDLELLPNGNVLVIAYEHHSAEEVFARGRDVDKLGEEGMWFDSVLEIRPTRPEGGEIVWRWRSWDHLVQDLDSERAGYGEISSLPGRIDINSDHRFEQPENSEEKRKREELERQMAATGYAAGAPPTGEEEEDDDKAKKREQNPDWLHTNAVSYLPEHDLIALSTPHLCELWVIDHSTSTAEAASSNGGRFGKGGELLYRYGSPRNYGIGGAVNRASFYQHDCTWQRGPNGELHLLFFNNGSRRPIKEHSTVEEIALPFDPERGFLREADAAFGPSEPAWSYAEEDVFYSPFISGAQRLANGNTLVCEGARGRVFEVTSEGRVVWDYYNPLGGDVEPTEQQGKAPPLALFRATRIPKDHPGLAGRL